MGLGDINMAQVKKIVEYKLWLNDKGEKVTNTDWHRITAWGKTAEIIEKYVTKGKEIAVEANRHGPTGTIQCRFDGEYMRWTQKYDDVDSDY